MQELIKHAERVAALLKERKETIAVSESSTGGLVTASLLAVPSARLSGARSATEENAMLQAVLARERFHATWGLGETGAAGPTGNRYGDPAGHCCIAVAGAERASRTLKTNRSERLENMHAFAAAALELLEDVLKNRGQSPKT